MTPIFATFDRLPMSPLTPIIPASKPPRYLTFTLGTESYGLPILQVREIIRLCPITPAPNMPAHLRGVINLRGTVIPVLDLRAKFSMPTAEYGERACIIVLQLKATASRPTLLGIMVDTVDEILPFTEAEIEPCPDFGSSTSAKYVRGMATVENGVKTLLEIERIFEEEGTITLTAADIIPPGQKLHPPFPRPSLPDQS